jgi:hypothetical protein
MTKILFAVNDISQAHDLKRIESLDLNIKRITLCQSNTKQWGKEYSYLYETTNKNVLPLAWRIRNAFKQSVVLVILDNGRVLAIDSSMAPSVLTGHWTKVEKQHAINNDHTYLLEHDAYYMVK